MSSGSSAQGSYQDNRKSQPGVNPVKFLFSFLEQFKRDAGIKEKSAPATPNPKKILQSLKGNEEKIKKLEQERLRFQTQDMRLFDEWKKEACAKELARLNAEIDERRALIEEIQKLQVDYHNLLQKKNPQPSPSREEEGEHDIFEDFFKKNFGERANKGEEGADFEFGEDEDADDDDGFFDIRQVNFERFYNITGWNEDFLRQVSKFTKKDRRAFVEHFFYSLLARDGVDSCYEFFAFVNIHAERLQELDEEKEFLLNVGAGETSSPLKFLFRKLMRDLHPDLRTNEIPSEFEKDLFVAVQRAYKNGNLASLKKAELDLALFRGKLDVSTDPRLLQKLQKEKSEQLKSIQSDLRKMKKNVEWDFEAKSAEEKMGIKDKIADDISFQTRQMYFEKQWIKRDILVLKRGIEELLKKPAKSADRARPAKKTHSKRR